MGCDFAVKMIGELDLIAISVEALVAGNVTEEGSFISAAAGASNASSCGGVEGGVFAVEGCIRKLEIEIVLNPSGNVLGG